MTGGPEKRTSLRADIQGLRALAVLAVISDHLLGWPRGGFVGVDVFFVISGFLITGLLLREYEKSGRISFVDFYRRRVKRILPAAALVIGVTLVAAWALFSRTRYTSTLWDAAWSSAFAANWRFAAVGTDYFQAGAPPSPLQHYWSLAVEEQFYAVWPLLMVVALFLAKRANRRHRGLATVGVAIGVALVASFVWAVYETRTDATVAYFSSLSRIWELGVGALLAVAMPMVKDLPSPWRLILAWTGVAGLVASLFLISPASTFPAPAAALPVLATALVIWAGTGLAPRYLWPLTNPISTYVGAISYSLYLWHWPVIVFGTAILNVLDRTERVILAAIFTTAAILSFHIVEDPIRRSSWLAPRDRTIAKRSRARNARTWILPAVAVVFAISVTTAVTTEISRQEQVPAWAYVDPPQDLPPEVSALQDSLASAVRTSRWPSLEPTMEQVLGGGQAPPEVERCGLLGKDRAPQSECTWGDPDAAHSLVIIGDSTSLGYVSPAMALIAEGWSVTSLGSFGCSYLDFPDLVREDQCLKREEDALAYIAEERPDVAVVSFHYQTVDIEARRNALSEFVSKFQDSVGDLVLVAPPPSAPDIGRCYSWWKQPFECVGRVPANWRLTADMERTMAVELDGHFVDSELWFCIQGYCPAFSDGVPTKRDQGHSSPAYQQRISPAFVEALRSTGVVPVDESVS